SRWLTHTLTIGLRFGKTPAAVFPASPKSARFSCHLIQAISLASMSTAGLATQIPLVNTFCNLRARSSADQSKQISFSCSGEINSGIPPVLLARNGIRPPRHSSTVLGELSTGDAINATRLG